MSPEQIGTSGLDLDARSGVHSLGMLLYELLTAQPAFDPAQLHHAAVDEVCRIIREERPGTSFDQTDHAGCRAPGGRRSVAPDRTRQTSRLAQGRLGLDRSESLGKGPQPA